MVQGLQARDLAAPVVVRFSDILAHRLRHLNDAFARAIGESEYRNRYAAVFPIKVNQQRLVVDEVYRYGREFGFGLEVGSKPELLAVMAVTESASDRLIVCNGFKDSSYIEAVILATKLGRTIIPVVENFAELELILRHAKTYARAPAHRRARQAGQRGFRPLARFGRREVQVRAVRHRDHRAARDAHAPQGMEDCLKLVHCHPGSQLQDIRRVKDAINELAHVYAELKLAGAGLEYIDVGGGLGIDYDGTGTNYSSSMNYTLDEYANDVVYRIASVCNARGVDHPMIVSESGRAIAAHHSVLIFNTLGSSRLDQFEVVARRGQGAGPRASPQPIRDLYDALRTHRRAPPGRVLPRRADRARRGACSCSTSGSCRSRDRAPGRAPVLGRLRAHPRLLPQARPDARGARGPRGRAGRHLLLQLLAVPVAARQLGDRSAVPDHADPSAATSGRRATACWPTSPAIRTDASTAS